jgi:hypothetical protein
MYAESSSESSRGKLHGDVLRWLHSISGSDSEDAEERKARYPGTAKHEHLVAVKNEHV